jgi:hypothetical protein
MSVVAVGTSDAPMTPRPFPDEAFGSWLGRAAACYRMGVDELIDACGIEVEIGKQGSRWLVAVPKGEGDSWLTGRCCPAAAADAPAGDSRAWCAAANRLDECVATRQNKKGSTNLDNGMRTRSTQQCS